MATDTQLLINQIETPDGAYWLQAKYDIDGKEIAKEYAKATSLNNYLEKTDASNTYLTKTDAGNTYLTKTNASNTYLTKTDASNTYAPKSEWDTFKKEADFGSGAIDTLAEIQSYIDSDKESAASMLSSLNNKSNIGHTHSVTATGIVSKPTFTGTKATISADYTPAGTVTKPTFTGTAGTATASYTPAGTVSKPTFTGTEAKHNHTFTGTAGTATASYTPAGTVSKPTFTGTEATSKSASTSTGHTTAVLTSVKTAGTLPNLTYTPPSCTHTAATFTPKVQNGVLSFEFGGGSINFSAGGAAFTQGEMPTFNTGSASTASHTHGVIATGSVSQPTFNGTEAIIEASYTPAGTVSEATLTPAGSVSQPTFSGTAATISASYTPAGSVSQPTFTGTEATISVSYTPAGSVSQPTFTGNLVNTNGDVKPTV